MVRFRSGDWGVVAEESGAGAAAHVDYEQKAMHIKRLLPLDGPRKKKSGSREKKRKKAIDSFSKTGKVTVPRRSRGKQQNGFFES